MGKQEEMLRITELLVRWVVKVRLLNYRECFDVNRISEDIAMKLLNLVYKFSLKNLNREKKAYPTIDLADEKRGFAFQVTSRCDPQKIRGTLEDFKKRYFEKKKYQAGLRFFILNDRFVLTKTIKECNRQYEFFKHDEHIYTIAVLSSDIDSLYDSDENRFREVMELLENEFGDNSWLKGPKVSLLPKLNDGSKVHLKDVSGPHGRFGSLQIDEHLLSGFRLGGSEESKWPYTNFSFNIHNQVEKENNLLTFLKRLPKSSSLESKITIISGEGGMGKTVTLISLWEEYLKSEQLGVPIFIQLNEINSWETSDPDEEFIVHQICKYYLDNNTPKSKQELSALMKSAIESGNISTPSIILLLDGLNEINDDDKVKKLRKELTYIIESCPGVQLVITSRLEHTLINWRHFRVIKLIGLDNTQIEQYLKSKLSLKSLSNIQQDKELNGLLKNPMMLTLYASTIVNKVQANADFIFIDEVKTTGELIWNYMESQVAQFVLNVNIGDKDKCFKRFLFCFLLPMIGYEMEKNGRYYISYANLNDTIDRCCKFFKIANFFSPFPDYENHQEYLRARLDDRDVLIEILTMKDSILVRKMEANNYFSFLHLDFRDFFAAKYLLNMAKIKLSQQEPEVPAEWTENTFSFLVRKFISAIEGEHNRRPFYNEDKDKWEIQKKNTGYLERMLNLLRGHFDECSGRGAANIIETIKIGRGELSGIDLRRLNLSMIPFNGVRCSRYSYNGYLAAKFDGSLVHEINFLPFGHSFNVNSIAYNEETKRILSASGDNTIKEWDAGSGLCLTTYTGHRDWVIKAVYSPDKKKILSASVDKTIIEWNLISGTPIRTYNGHESSVNSAVYSENGEKILSASADSSIKIWDVENGNCLMTLCGHLAGVNCAVFSPCGTKILSTSDDKTIKEWDLDNGKCIMTYTGHSSTVNSAVYHTDGEKILSAASDNLIKVWNVEDGQCIKTLTGHGASVNSAIYHPIEEKILSASVDKTIKEWDPGDGKCIGTYIGHTCSVNCAIYIEDGNRILSAASDNHINVWDIVTFQCGKTYHGYDNGVNCAVFTRDGKKILFASHDQTIKEWDVEKNRCIQVFSAELKGLISAFYMNDEMEVISTSCHEIHKAWEVKSGRCLDSVSTGSSIPPQHGDFFYMNLEIQISKNNIRVKDTISCRLLLEIENIPGLLIQGCTLRNLDSQSKWSVDGTNSMISYGGDFG